MGKLSSLTELSSSGKSGSFFYFTEDSNELKYQNINFFFILDKYMIKTISKNEKQLLRKIMKNYYNHIMEN
jgi:1-phosphatidylinositol-4-phosphate 5-kinase